MRNVLIMGGSYFIGRAIAERLSREMEVTLLNRGSRPPIADARQLVCDRNDAAQMKEVLRGHRFDYIVDVCGLNRAQSELLVDSLEDTSSLKALVFISSSAVYDVEHLAIPFKETDRLAPNRYWTYYGTDKIAAEAAYRAAFADTPTRTVFLRPPYVYGERNYARRESFVFDHLLNDRPIIIPRSNPRLQFINARDLAEIVAALLSKADRLPADAVYNVGNSDSVTCRQWVEACAEAAGLPAKIVMYDYAPDGWSVRDFFPFFDYDNVLDVAAVKECYSDETPFVEGLREAFAWFQANREQVWFDERVARNEREILSALED